MKNAARLRKSGPDPDDERIEDRHQPDRGKDAGPGPVGADGRSGHAPSGSMGGTAPGPDPLKRTSS